MDISAWLHSLRLQQYEQAFRDHGVDSDVLPELTLDDLKDLGVVQVGHRRKLLSAIAALRQPPRALLDPAAERNNAQKPATEPAPDRARAERRHLTVMFCDLAGSTVLSGRMDPEDLQEVIGAFQGCVASAVTRFGGTVAKYMGDGVLVYFGYPHAHEDDAERAVRAGLELVRSLQDLRPQGEALQMRVGIATGQVVVGDLIGSGAAQEHAVVGETPNLAARLQGLAEPSAVLIAAETRRLVGELFELADLGAVSAKGFAEPVRAWRVLREGKAESRFEALRGRARTPLVGRQDELGLIDRRWAQALAGEGQVVLLSGEPGLGKSRLVAATEEMLAREAVVRLRYFCSPHHQNSALFPVLQQLERAAGFAREEDGHARLRKLRTLLASDTDPEDFALLSDLLSLPTEDLTLPKALSPQKKKQRLLEALVHQLAMLARAGPVLMVWEDVHWIDPSSRELLELTLERILHLPVLLLVTFRPQFQPGWAGREHVTVVAPRRLSRRDQAVMVGRLTGGTTLPSEVLDQIIERTDGVPLFIEEMTNSVLESGLVRQDGEHFVLTGALAPLAIPATLQDSLMARLDRVPIAREVAQIGAAIGREFSFALLAAVSGQDEAALRMALERLTAADVVFARGSPPDASYTFKHALVQDAAYTTLLRSRRQELHARIGTLTEERFPELAETQPEVLAYHFERAGLAERAVDHLLKASQRAVAQSATAEAIAQLNKGLTLLPVMPPGRDTEGRELELQIALGTALCAVSGFAAPAVGQAFSRARQLCDGLNNRESLPRVLAGLAAFHRTRGESDQALRCGTELLQFPGPAGHLTVGITAVVRGEFRAALQHLEAAAAAYEGRAAISPVAVLDALVAIPSHKADALAVTGYLDSAVQNNAKALQRSIETNSAAAHALALAYACHVAALARDYDRLNEHATELARLCEEQRFALWGARATLFRGYALAKTDPQGSGRELLHKGMIESYEVGAGYYKGRNIAMLIETSGFVAPENSVRLQDWRDHIERSGERWNEAELCRFEGEITLATSGDIANAEGCFKMALAVAHAQDAKLFELRAAMSLARLWQSQGRKEDAHRLLTPIFSWFTEGLDTPDLQDAKALLGRCSGW